MAKKKVSKKAATKVSKSKEIKVGRPEGSTSYIPVGLEVRNITPLSRANSVNPLRGSRRIILEVAPTNEEDGLRLQALGQMLQSKDASLFRLMDKTVKSLS